MADDSDLSKAEFNNAFVLMQCFGYLRRDPHPASGPDFTGFNFQPGKPDESNGNYSAAEMGEAFLSPTEYRRPALRHALRTCGD